VIASAVTLEGRGLQYEERESMIEGYKEGLLLIMLNCSSHENQDSLEQQHLHQSNPTQHGKAKSTVDLTKIP
jgi:glutathione peroxidase-family protein